MRAVKAGLVVLANTAAKFLVEQLAEEGERTLAGDTGLGQIVGACRIGAGFLRATEGQKLAHGGLLASCDDAHRRLATASQRRADPCNQRKDRNAAGGAVAFADADDMAAGDMAQLVRNHTLHFVGAVGSIDQPAVQIDDLPACHKGVDRRIVDQHHIDIARLQPGRFDQGRGNLVQKRLGFRIA